MGRPYRNLGLGVAIGLTLASGATRAQDVSGPAIASDGDTLQMAGITVRLHGIDAPEHNQICMRGSAPWPCGMESSERLAALISGRSVRCEQRDTDIYGRIVATCRVGTTDLSAELAESGLAIALPQFSTFYVANEKRARDRRRGLWDSEFQLPSEYRAAHPPLARPSLDTKPLRLLPGTRPTGVYYRGCNEARAAGVAPIYRGQPGYRPEMDGDSDGIACEPYRGR